MAHFADYVFFKEIAVLACFANGQLYCSPALRGEKSLTYSAKEPYTFSTKIKAVLASLQMVNFIVKQSVSHIKKCIHQNFVNQSVCALLSKVSTKVL